MRITTDFDLVIDETLVETYGGLFNLILVIGSSILLILGCIFFLSIEFGKGKKSYDRKALSVLILFSMLLPFSSRAQSNSKLPSIKEIVSLGKPGNPQISPNGKHVVFEVSSADWMANEFDAELWVSKNGEIPYVLTNNPNSSSYSPKWSPDGQWIAFLARGKEHNQIFVSPIDGEGVYPALFVDGDIYNFEWSPDSKRFAFTLEERQTQNDKLIKEHYGDFKVDDEDYKMSWLYIADFNPELANPEKHTSSRVENATDAKIVVPTALIENVDFTIDTFKWSPDGKKIAFDKQPDPLVNTFIRSDIGIIDVASKTWEVLVANKGYDFVADWSPDGKSIVYVTAMDNDTTNYYSNSHIFKIDVDGENNFQLAKGFDEHLHNLTWTEKGIYAIAGQKMKTNLFLIDPEKGTIRAIGKTPDRIDAFSILKNGLKTAFIGENDTSLKEVYTWSLKSSQPRKLTTFSDKIAQWKVAQSEVVSWKAEDGTLIEGVLHKPKDFDPKKKYPLIVSIHGGPTMTDAPRPVPSFYPTLHLLDKGALVLRPNYRGSGGYGEAFRTMGADSMGITYTKDILAGIDHLEDLNIIDNSKIGCMGWSAGGYICAFLATTSNRFKAISVGAGYSNNATFYFTTDVHPFMRQYLKATPWSNAEIYRKTSPISYINQASTPTLIQHGKHDSRVPIANAYELLQGLRDVGITSRLIIYDGGHTIYNPKSRLAAAWHNLQWFGKYLFGEDIELPIE